MTISSATINPQRLFTACCVALIVTAMTFAIRAGILTQLSADFNLNNTQLGWINGMAFLGFPVAMMFGGLIYNHVGARTLMYLAFICHLLGLALTISATGFWSLLLSSFFIGFANGSVEAACNPLIADIYHTRKTAMLNKFHVWFPGGIVIGALVSTNDFWPAVPNHGEFRDVNQNQYQSVVLAAVYFYVLLHDRNRRVRVWHPAVG
jgi:MFS family permease